MNEMVGSPVEKVNSDVLHLEIYMSMGYTVKVHGKQWELLDWVDLGEEVILLTDRGDLVSLILDRFPILLPDSSEVCNKLNSEVKVWKNYKGEWEVKVKK